MGETEIIKTATVYRVDYKTRTKMRIGTLAERRRSDRGDNVKGLLHLARRRYSTTAEEALSIIIVYD